MECEVCKKPSGQKCSACHGANYCSENHQKEHWRIHRKTCNPIALRDSPAFGRHWVATRDMKAGTLIVKESPILRITAWPTWTFEMWEGNTRPLERAQCLACGAYINLLGTSVYRCSKCTWPVCNRECEGNLIHATNECIVFKCKHFTFPPPRKEITPRRIDWAVGMIRLGRLRTRNAALFTEIMRLQSNPDIPADDRTLDGLRSAISAISYYFNTDGINYLSLSTEEMEKYLWIIKLNGLNCSYPDSVDEENLTSRQDCIYLKTSMFSNSCSPNCSQSQIIPGPDYVMSVRTAVPIKKGQPLTIAYCGSDCYGTMDRQRELRSKFYFICKCNRCTDPTELGTHTSSVACSSCIDDKHRATGNDNKDLGYLLPEDPLAMDDDTTLWRCNRCNKTTPACTFMPRVKRLGRSIKSTRNSNQGFYRRVIEENSGRFLHPNHWILQMAASCILSKYHLPDDTSPPFIMEEVKRLAHFRMKIQDVLNPGLSFVRAMYQRDYVLLVFPKLLANSFQPTVSEETKQQFRECLKMLSDIIDYYRLFKDSLPDAEINSQSLVSIKASIESLHFLR